MDAGGQAEPDQSKFWEEKLNELVDNVGIEFYQLLIELEVDAELATTAAERVYPCDFRSQLFHMLYNSWITKQLPLHNTVLLRILETALQAVGRTDIVRDVIPTWRDDPNYMSGDYNCPEPTNNKYNQYEILTDKRLSKLAARLAGDYLRLAIYLGISHEQVKSYDRDYRGFSTRDKITGMLIKWRRSRAGRGFEEEQHPAKDLLAALEKIQNNVLKQEVQKWIEIAQKTQEARKREQNYQASGFSLSGVESSTDQSETDHSVFVTNDTVHAARNRFPVGEDSSDTVGHTYAEPPVGVSQAQQQTRARDFTDHGIPVVMPTQSYRPVADPRSTNQSVTGSTNHQSVTDQSMADQASYQTATMQSINSQESATLTSRTQMVTAVEGKPQIPEVPSSLDSAYGSYQPESPRNPESSHYPEEFGPATEYISLDAGRGNSLPSSQYPATAN